MIETPKLEQLLDGRVKFLIDWEFMGVTLPAGFVSDGTSSPWWARCMIPRTGKYVFASYLHDYCLEIMSRKEASIFFWNGLKFLGASKYQILLRHTAVRIYDLTIAKLK